MLIFILLFLIMSRTNLGFYCTLFYITISSRKAKRYIYTFKVVEGFYLSELVPESFFRSSETFIMCHLEGDHICGTAYRYSIYYPVACVIVYQTVSQECYRISFTCIDSLTNTMALQY